MACNDAEQPFQVADMPNLNGYVVIVTGGNSGIGYETTLQLARHGARVYIASRSQERVNEAISDMQKTGGSLDVRFLKLDLQNLRSVKASAEEFLQRESRLDILINNAGIMASPYELTGDGFEKQWQICFLAHHAFTLALLPLLRSTAQQNPGNKSRVRIVNVSSDLALRAGPNSINYDDPNLSTVSGALAPLRRYGHSKQASIIAAKAINDRYSSFGITAYSLHPGIVKSNLQTHDPTLLGQTMRLAMKIRGSSTALEGSLNTLFCATSPHAPKNSGRYFSPVGKLDRRTDKWLNDPEAVRKLWDLANWQLEKNGYILEL